VSSLELVKLPLSGATNWLKSNTPDQYLICPKGSEEAFLCFGQLVNALQQAMRLPTKHQCHTQARCCC
jgi:hypothetical protein